jgi:predicted MFS family arabinose efflux permease
MQPRAATFATFMVNGAIVGTWLALIPWKQAQLGVSKATLGFSLLCMALGSLVAMPVAGAIINRRPSAQVVRVAALLACLCLPLPLLAGTPVVLGAALAVLGAVNGSMDVSMNAHGVAVERDLNKPIMSSLHGGWSVGGFIASGLVVAASAAGIDPRLWGAIVGVALCAGMLWIATRLGRASMHEGDAGGGFALPSRAVLLIGILCLLAMVAEGAISDWSGIYLRQNLGAGDLAAIGYTGFALGMAAGRLGGDVLNSRLGPSRLLRGGMALVAIALGGVLIVGEPAVAVAGFALAGLGIANAVPLLFSAAGRVPPAGTSLAAVFTVGYTAFIAGPPLIGILADGIGLPETLSLLVLAALTVTALGGRVPTPARRR